MKNRFALWLFSLYCLIASVFTIAYAQQKDPLDDGVLRVLAIGNSFSEDAIENNLHELAKATNKKIVIGNLYIGGAPLSLHATNASGNKKAYAYRKIDLDGHKTNSKGTSILMALEDDAWDYISFQQASRFSGQLESYSPYLYDLKTYVSSHVKYANTKYIFHQTWAYSELSTHDGFSNYNKSQKEMYQAIMEVSKAITEDKTYDFTMLIPSGTAIQNMRNTFIGDNLNRDGYHLDLGFGRFTAACTWFEKLFNEDATHNPFIPAAVPAKIAEMAKVAAHSAASNPYSVTRLMQYIRNTDAKPFIDCIKISFGKAVYLKGWNSVNSAKAGYEINSLKNMEEELTRVNLIITESFNTTNNNGIPGTNIKKFIIPSEVASSSYFGNSKGLHDGLLIKRSAFELKNLDQDKTYTLAFYSSREGKNESNNCETQFTVKGDNSKTTTINSTNNNHNLAFLKNIKPDKNNTIKIEVSAGSKNNNVNGYYYLNALVLTVD